MNNRNLPQLLRDAERRVNANVWPNKNPGADSHLASIPANRDTDTDLLLIEAADRLEALEATLRTAHAELTDHGHQELPECECRIAHVLAGSGMETSAQRTGKSE